MLVKENRKAYRPTMQWFRGARWILMLLGSAGEVYAQSETAPVSSVPVLLEATDNERYVAGFRTSQSSATCTVPCRLSVAPGDQILYVQGSRNFDVLLNVGRTPTRVSIMRRNGGRVGAGITLLVLGVGGLVLGGLAPLLGPVNAPFDLNTPLNFPSVLMFSGLLGGSLMSGLGLGLVANGFVPTAYTIAEERRSAHSGTLHFTLPAVSF